jgi:CPA1 family monovalent cation:H+ antiporter
MQAGHHLLSAFDMVSLLLLIAVLISVLNEHWLKLPRPVALLLGALGVSGITIAAAALSGHTEVREHLRTRILGSEWPQILLDGMLALLLFAGSLHVNLGDLRQRARTVLALATAGVILATGIFGAGIWLLLAAVGIPVPLGWCLVIGAILAPTDAVAVEGLLAKVNLPPLLRAVISGESLFNDGAAVVLFSTTLALTSGRTDMVGHGHLAKAILIEGSGGIALGAAAGYLTCRLVRLTAEHTLALMISLALVLCTYRAAVALEVSGPIAVVTAGIVFTTMLGATPGVARLRDSLSTMWTLVDDLLNTMLYMLIGFVAIAIDMSWKAMLATLLAVPLALLTRFVSVAIPRLILDLRVPNLGRSLFVLTWAGLRGGVSIALALVLPPSPYRDLLLAICFGVVIFTVVVQGLSLPRIVAAFYGKAPAEAGPHS